MICEDTKLLTLCHNDNEHYNLRVIAVLARLSQQVIKQIVNTCTSLSTSLEVDGIVL